MKDPSFQDASGNFSPVAFQAALRNIGMSEAGYLYSLREQNLRRQLLTTVGDVANSPQVLIDALNRYNEERRILRISGLVAIAVLVVVGLASAVAINLNLNGRSEALQRAADTAARRQVTGHRLGRVMKRRAVWATRPPTMVRP